MAANGAQMSDNLYERQPADVVARPGAGRQVRRENGEVEPFRSIASTQQAEGRRGRRGHTPIIWRPVTTWALVQELEGHEKVLSNFNNLEGKFTLQS